MPTVGHARGLGREPADHRRVRLVHVHDVVAAVAQLAARAPGSPRATTTRFDTAPFIGRPIVRPSEIT